MANGPNTVTETVTQISLNAIFRMATPLFGTLIYTFFGPNISPQV